jgi:hypothetical protein
MFPVGLVGRYKVSSPIVKNGTLIGFYDGWIGGRKYPVDMAGMKNFHSLKTFDCVYREKCRKKFLMYENFYSL